MNHKTIELLNAFWVKFTTYEMYDAGFGDVALLSGACHSNNLVDVVSALSYVSGAAWSARLACSYASHQWRVNDVVLSGCDSLLKHVRSAPGLSPDMAARLLADFENRIKGLLARAAS